MKASELRGRAIVSLAEAQKLGEVDDVLLAPGQSRVAGIRIKHGLFGPTQYLAHLRTMFGIRGGADAPPPLPAPPASGPGWTDRPKPGVRR